MGGMPNLEISSRNKSERFVERYGSTYCTHYCKEKSEDLRKEGLVVVHNGDIFHRGRRVCP